ncbi:MAG: LysM peptidoglycan-binding domain-containing protein [Pseudomonadota bacterium]
MILAAKAKLFAILGASAAAATGIGTVVYLDRQNNATEQSQVVAEAPAEPEAPADPQADTNAAPAEPEQEVAALTEPTPEVAPTENVVQQPAIGPSIAPSVDVLRVEPDGSFVIAGAAGAGAAVDIVVNGQTILSVTADENGDWTALGDQLLPPGDHIMALRATEPERAAAQSEVEITIGIDETGETPLVAVAEPGQPSEIVQRPAPAPEPVDVAEAEVPEPVVEPEVSAEVAEVEAAAEAVEEETPAEEPAVSEPEAIDTAAADPDILSEPEPVAEPDTPRPDTAIGIVEVENDTTVFVTGESAPGDTVRVYLNGLHVGDAETDDAGTWSLTFERALPPGRYSVRADVLDVTNGSVIARASVRFDRVQIVAADSLTPPAAPASEEQAEAPVGEAATPDRETPEIAVTDPMPDDQAGTETAAVSVDGTTTSDIWTDDSAAGAVEDIPQVVIERGDNLWRIARQIYGRGIRYTLIFEANRSQIDDPDLIFPDQIFTIPLPDEDEAASANDG